MKKLCLLAAVSLLTPFAAHAKTGDALDTSHLAPTFTADFNSDSTLNTNTWKTNYYFGCQPDNKGCSTGPYAGFYTPAQVMHNMFSARTISGEDEVYVDQSYCGLSPFSFSNGSLVITANKMTPDQKATCGQGARDYSSGLITTQNSFSQTYGYFEMRAILPSTSGTWPAFWLLPVTKTVDNGGRLAEIDVLEVMNGTRYVDSQHSQYAMDQTDIVKMTLHSLTVDANGNFVRDTTGKVVPETSLGAQQKIADLSNGFHTFGVLWTPTAMTYYIDRVEVFSTPNPHNTINDPHYLVANLAVAGGPLVATTDKDKTGKIISISSGIAAGDPGAGSYPAKMVIDYIHAYQISATPVVPPPPPEDPLVTRATQQVASIIDNMKVIFTGKLIPSASTNADITPLIATAHALPTDMVHNTGYVTGVWNNKVMVLSRGGTAYIISYWAPMQAAACTALASNIVRFSGSEKPVHLYVVGGSATKPSATIEVTAMTPQQIADLKLTTCTGVEGFFDTTH